MEQCQCILCKHSRKEVSDEFFKGYVFSQIESTNGVLKHLEKLGYKETGLDKEDSIGAFMSVLQYELDFFISISDDLKKK